METLKSAEQCIASIVNNATKTTLAKLFCLLETKVEENLLRNSSANKEFIIKNARPEKKKQVVKKQ